MIKPATTLCNFRLLALALLGSYNKVNILKTKKDINYEKNIFTFFFVTLFTKIIIGQANTYDFLLYLNQEPSGLIPKVFAPNIISTSNEYEFGSAVIKEGDKP